MNETAVVENILHGAVRLRPIRDGVMIANGSELIPQATQWLWLNWLALGKLHLLAGCPGTGKTTIAMALAATVTIGGRWPDGSRCEIGNTLIWSGEDDCESTLLPRLLAAGADRRRVYFITGSRIKGKEMSFDPARDMKALQVETERIGNVRLIIVDPIVTAVTGDSHKNTETRRDLQPLVDLAANTNAALLGITHLSKGGAGGDPVQRVLGSVAFVAVARVVLVAAKVADDEGKDKRILARGKSNIGPDGGGFEYHLEQSEPLPGIPASLVMWGASVQGSARDLLAEDNGHGDDGEERNALGNAKEFLREILKNCAVFGKDVEAHAKDAGISMRTVRRASDQLAIIKKPGFDKRWYWSLPDNLANFPSVDNMANMANMANLNPELTHASDLKLSNLANLANFSVSRNMANLDSEGSENDAAQPY